ncbi:MAG: SDR family oxidoreductase [Ignavibacteriae bacterium]|nr:SDR family oxidoreductase [Ignavibacteriota bacterium]MCB9244062.1 SDR family oxidoreductase [Ignavibacteriales bacterium]
MNFVITGTSRGIGKYLAEYYSNDESNIIFGCSRGDCDIDKPNYIHYKIDITEPKFIHEMFNEIRKGYGSLDVLINNAGVNVSNAFAYLVPIEKIKENYEVNFLAPVLFSREALKLMLNKKAGRIINFGSMMMKHSPPGTSFYTASKDALYSFTKVFAKEIFSNGITCNMIAPAVVETDLAMNANKDILDELLYRNAIKHPGKLTDISNTIDWLISPGAESITGQIIYLGGV